MLRRKQRPDDEKPDKKRRAEPKPFDPGLADLARAVHGAQVAPDPRRPPSPELCKVGQALADRLFIAERRGVCLDDLLEEPAVKDLLVRSESDTRLPKSRLRPRGSKPTPRSRASVTPL